MGKSQGQNVQWPEPHGNGFHLLLEHSRGLKCHPRQICSDTGMVWVSSLFSCVSEGEPLAGITLQGYGEMMLV